MDNSPPRKKIKSDTNNYLINEDSQPSQEILQNSPNLNDTNVQENQVVYQPNEDEMDIDELNISNIQPNEDENDNNVLDIDLEPNAWSQDSADTGNTSINTNDWSIAQGNLPNFGEGNENNFLNMSNDSLDLSQNSSQGNTSNEFSQISMGSQGGKHKKIKKKTNKRRSKKMRSTKRKSNKRKTKKNKTRKGGNGGFTTTAETSPLGYLDNMEISQANMPKP